MLDLGADVTNLGVCVLGNSLLRDNDIERLCTCKL